jgi:aldehyde:ferredoxin oxidoreductase
LILKYLKTTITSKKLLRKETIMKANFGQYSWIDLSKNKVISHPIPDDWYQEYLRRRDCGARILLGELDTKVDPFSHENILVFSSDPFQGLAVLAQQFGNFNIFGDI